MFEYFYEVIVLLSKLLFHFRHFVYPISDDNFRRQFQTTIIGTNAKFFDTFKSSIDVLKCKQ